jgi:hypothetical protein
MKFATASKSVMMELALLLASSASARTKVSLLLGSPVTVNGTTLKPGDYKVQWEGTGPNVELSFLQGKNVVARTPAHVVELQTPSPQDAALTIKNDSGSNSLVGLLFRGRKFQLDLGEASDGMQAGSRK